LREGGGRGKQEGRRKGKGNTRIIRETSRMMRLSAPLSKKEGAMVVLWAHRESPGKTRRKARKAQKLKKKTHHAITKAREGEMAPEVIMWVEKRIGTFSGLKTLLPRGTDHDCRIPSPE